LGRGVISEVGGKILETFATALAAQLGVEVPAQAAEPAVKPAPRKRTPRTRTTAAAKPVETPAETTEPAEPAAPPKPAVPKAPAPKVPAKPAPAKPAPVKAAAAAKPKPVVNAEVKPAPVRPVAAVPTPTPTAVPATNGAPVNVRAEEPRPAPPKLRVVAEPQVEPIDLLDYAGPSVLKRVLPLVAGAAVLFLLVRWLRKR
jgi:hypothetical protein